MLYDKTPFMMPIKRPVVAYLLIKLKPCIDFYVYILCAFQFSALYLVSLVVILIGFIAFNAVPTPTASSSSSHLQEANVSITAEDEEGDKIQYYHHRSLRESNIGVVVCSTKL